MKKFLISICVLVFCAVTVVSAQEYSFTRDLSVGSFGDDVTALQVLLMSKGFDIPAVSAGRAARGYFGEQTRQALKKFQEGQGLPGTGYFGPMTRGKIRTPDPVRTDSRSPVINGIDAPTTLSVGEMGTWNVRATDPQNGTLSYSVDWGDVQPGQGAMQCPEGYVCTPNMGVAAAPTTQQGSSFTHSYSQARTYKVVFTVTNGLGLSTKSSATVKVVSSNIGALNVIVPNGGEVWQKGTTQTVRWNSPAYFRATYASLILRPYNSGASACAPDPTGMPCATMSYTIARNISINQNSYSWNVGQYMPEVVPAIYPTPTYFVPEGQYILQVCETGTTNCASSNKPFTISAGSLVSVIAPNGGENWTADSAQYLRWSMPTSVATNTRLDLYLDQAGIQCISAPCGYTYVLDKNIPITMVYNWLVATDVDNIRIPVGSYTLRVCTAGSTTACDSSDKPFTISPVIIYTCPTWKITNAMPNVQSNAAQSSPTSYYVMSDGSRRELVEFDADWIRRKCTVREQTAY